MKNIKAIIFDAYGTLFDVNSAAQKCKSKIGDKWEAFANYWRTNQLEYTWLRSLMNRHKDFWKITEDSLDKSMKAFNIDASMRNELLDLYKVLSPFEEVPEVLKELNKPYICGSSYFLKMMEFKKGPWCDIMDGLYWKFIDKNKKFFKSNPRLSMMVNILEKIDVKRKNKIFTAANNFIKENTHD